MKKVCYGSFLFLFLCSIFLFPLNIGNAKDQVYLEETDQMMERKVELIFKNKTVTTKTISSFLEDTGKIITISFQNNLPYLDETMRENLSRIYSSSIQEYERLFRKKLESYGFFDASEQIQRNGVVLEKIDAYLPLTIVMKLKNIKGIDVKFL